MTSRRGFLSAILAGAAAPAVVKASSLMKLVPTESGILTYKMSGRYDINFDHWVRESDSTITLYPSKLIVPAGVLAEARRILNAEFDKMYAQHRGFK